MLRTTLSSSSSFSAHPYPSRHHHHHYSLRLSKLRHHLQAIASRNLSKSSSSLLSFRHLTPSECATVYLCVCVCASVLEIFIAPLVLYPFSSCSWRAAPSSGPQLEHKQFANAFSMRSLEMIIKYHKSGLKSQRTRFYSLWSVKAYRHHRFDLTPWTKFFINENGKYESIHKYDDFDLICEQLF